MVPARRFLFLMVSINISTKQVHVCLSSVHLKVKANILDNFSSTVVERMVNGQVIGIGESKL